MVDENHICKIYFYDANLDKIINIIGVISKKQLISSLYPFIELKNYGNKVISKKDLEKVVFYEKQPEIYMPQNTLDVKDKTEIEG
jgi:hypothetical protein